MWGKPAAATTCATWRLWENAEDWTGEAVRPAIPWSKRALIDPGEDIGTPPCALKPCNRCGLKVKVGLTRLSAGAVSGATNKHNYPQDLVRRAMGGGRESYADQRGAVNRTGDGGGRLSGEDGAIG